MILSASQPAALTIIQAPSGRFIFVGNVPPALAFEWEAESDLDAALHCGPGIAKKIAERNGRTFKSRSYETREVAQKEAMRLGYKVAA